MKDIIPRPEHPRPDFERNKWMNLNGKWDFEFDDYNQGETEYWYKQKTFSRKIVVPFCFQSELSGINDKGLHEYVWYKREFDLPDQFVGEKIILHFGAVDYFAKIWINGNLAGTHKGGHTPFKLDVSRFVKNKGNILVIKAEDSYECIQPRGKQYWKEKPERCWYTATTGIWQTVWIEAVGEIYIDRIRLAPDIDRRNVGIEIFLSRFEERLQIAVSVKFEGNVVKEMMFKPTERITKLTVDIKENDYVDEIHYWTPEMPKLYDIEFMLVKGIQQLDYIKSYFGMRKISVKGSLILLNNKPYYQKLILDQGYWPQSLLTPPSDDAIRLDIEMTKKFGFNGARKHQKIEDPRYYYWADKLGLLVWGEMPSAYEFNTEEIENITKEWIEFINRDYNHPCIITWVPLNESWGVRNILVDECQQNFARTLYYITKAMDNTRLVSTNDGWEQVDPSDICGIHDYIAYSDNFCQKYINVERILEKDAQGRLLYAQGNCYKGQPVLITEYGGIAFVSESEDNWGYFGAVNDEESFFHRFSSITSAIRNNSYICGYCYTQLTDVMQEANGLMTADRMTKVNLERIYEINS